MDLEKLTKPLEIKDIDFRVQSINKGWYATILAYKDARVDMNRLDEVAWPSFWKREHSDNNANCKVSIYNKEIKEWIVKEDVWTKSATEAEKGLASDSFKRACFNWGIWRELYDYPVIQIKLNSNEFKIEWTKAKATWDLKLKEWKWSSEFSEWNLISLVARDNNWKVRFSFWMWDDTQVSPEETTTKPKSEDELPRFSDVNLQNLIELKNQWQKFTMADIRKKYKIAKRYNDDLEEFVIN